MLTAKTSRALVAVAAVLCLAACTNNSSGESTSATTSAAAASSSAGSTVAQSAPSGAAPTNASGTLTSVPGLSQEALDVMNQPQYALGQWAIAVRDMDTGEQIVALNADTLFEPASVTKTYSAGAAWLEFGPDTTVTTPVKRTGEVADGTLNGNLVLVGKGDITMGGRTKPDGTVDFTNLDHNDANPIPGATLTPEDPLTGLERPGRAGQGIGYRRGDRRRDRRRPAVAVASWSASPSRPMIVNQNVIDVTTHAGARRRDRRPGDEPGGRTLDR